jgi:photosystem II stability/assembly factor-like uncharacterized protein
MLPSGFSRCSPFLSAAVLGCALAGCAPAAPAAGPEPEPTPTESAPSWIQVGEAEAPITLRMAAFLNAEFGVIGGPNAEGFARTTADGGKTWTAAENSSMCLWGLDVIDEKTIWECNTSDVRVSVDGGLTWSDKIRGNGSPGCKISGVDSQTAFTVQPGKFTVTHDGGVTREMLALPADLYSGQVAAISFRSVNDGYILDVTGTLHATTDGGKTWAAMPSPDLASYGAMTVVADEGLPYAAVRFFGADNGLMILSLVGGGASRLVALRTADGGTTWTEQLLETKIGIPYLSHDGKFLTIVPLLKPTVAVILHYTAE